jgi:hypothetical protein
MRRLTCVPATVYHVLYPFKPHFRCVQAQHFRLFCWVLVALIVEKGPGTIKSFSRWVPERVTYWALMRMLRSGLWAPDFIIREMARVLLATLPPPEDRTLYLLGDPTIKAKRGRKHPLARTTRMNEYAPYVFGIQMVVVVAAWGRFRVPVSLGVVDPKRRGHANSLFRQALRQVELPWWAEHVVVLADAGCAANATLKVITQRGWAFVFAIPRSRTFSDDKTVRDLVTHVPKRRYRRVATRKPTGGRVDSWVYARRAKLNGVGDVTIVLSKKRRNTGPKGVKIIVTNLEQVSAAEILSTYSRRWGVELVFKELKSGLHLGRMQVTKEPGRVKRSLAMPVIAYLLVLRLYGHEEPRMKEFNLFRLKERFIEEVFEHEASRLEFRWKRKLDKLRPAA